MNEIDIDVVDSEAVDVNKSGCGDGTYSAAVAETATPVPIEAPSGDCEETHSNSSDSMKRPQRQCQVNAERQNNASCQIAKVVKPTDVCASSANNNKNKGKNDKGGGVNNTTFKEINSVSRLRQQKLDPASVFAAIHEETTRTKCREIIHLAGADGNHGEKSGDFTLVTRRSKTDPMRKRPPPIRGTKENFQLSTAEKSSCLFVTGLGPNVSAEHVKEYIDQAVKVQCRCEKMNTRRDKITSSFKIYVPTNVKDALLNEEMWGSGVTVNHFLHLRRRQSYMGDQGSMT